MTSATLILFISMGTVVVLLLIGEAVRAAPHVIDVMSTVPGIGWWCLQRRAANGTATNDDLLWVLSRYSNEDAPEPLRGQPMNGTRCPRRGPLTPRFQATLEWVVDPSRYAGMHPIKTRSELFHMGYTPSTFIRFLLDTEDPDLLVACIHVDIPDTELRDHLDAVKRIDRDAIMMLAALRQPAV